MLAGQILMVYDENKKKQVAVISQTAELFR
jgi:hypothetical protein